MKLEDHINKLKQIYEKHGNLDLYYYTDDEGNDLNQSSYLPSVVLKNESLGRYFGNNIVPFPPVEKEEFDQYIEDNELEEYIKEDGSFDFSNFEKIVILN